MPYAIPAPFRPARLILLDEEGETSAVHCDAVATMPGAGVYYWPVGEQQPHLAPWAYVVEVWWDA